MSLRDPSQWIGQFLVRPTAAAIALLTQLERMVDSVGNVPLRQSIEEPSPILMISLHVDASVGASTTKTGMRWFVPFPIEILSFQPACETAAGATGTVDLLVDGTSVLAAAVDVKTDLVVGKPTSIVDTAYEVDHGSYLQLSAASGSGGAMTGAVAVITFRRR